MPVKTFLNCTIPALVNMSVGSLCGTSGEEATISCPFFLKKSRKADRISLTPFISSGSQFQTDLARLAPSREPRLLLWDFSHDPTPKVCNFLSIGPPSRILRVKLALRANPGWRQTIAPPPGG